MLPLRPWEGKQHSFAAELGSTFCLIALTLHTNVWQNLPEDNRVRKALQGEKKPAFTIDTSASARYSLIFTCLLLRTWVVSNGNTISAAKPYCGISGIQYTQSIGKRFPARPLHLQPASSFPFSLPSRLTLANQLRRVPPKFAYAQTEP